MMMMSQRKSIVLLALLAFFATHISAFHFNGHLQQRCSGRYTQNLDTPM